MIVIALFFIILNTVLTKEYLVQASTAYREDIPIYSVDCEEKKCAITFDCAWGASDIPDILNSLEKYNVKATFFIVGIWAEKYPDMVKLIHDKGHEIANHGYSHQHMAFLPEIKVMEEISRCSDSLENIIGEKTKLFRAPYGEYNANTVKSAKKLDYTSIQWDCDSLDWKKDMSKEDIYSRVIKKVSKGSIILFHNDTQYTVNVLPGIMDSLNQNGYQCVTVSDLLLKEKYRIRYDGRQIRE